MKNIKHFLSIVDKQRDHIALGLMSDPGLSKTAQLNQWAEENPINGVPRRVVELIISQRMPSEISGMPMPVDETKKMEIYDYDTLLQMKDGDILFLDEFTNGNIQTLNACLTLVQGRFMISGKKLPSILIVAAGNPQGRCDLLPQTKQRFWWVTVRYDAQCWGDYIYNKWGMKVDSLLNKYIENQYRDGFKSDKWNYWTPRTAENMIRIAREIDIDDPFWQVGEIDNQLKMAIYKTVKSIHNAQVIGESFLAWVNMQMNSRQIDEDMEDLKQLKMELSHLSTHAEFGEYVQHLEDSVDVGDNTSRLGSIGVKFIKWMKTQDDPRKNLFNPKI